MTSAPACRACAAPLHFVLIDLGVMPPCESYVSVDRRHETELSYPLRVFVCEDCYLVQIEALVSPQAIFSEYAYFSSYSETWLKHAQRFAERTIERFNLDSNSLVVELGSNDGYLLQYFVAAGTGALGIEPAGNVAAAATRRNVPTEVAFFGEGLGRRLAGEGRAADVIVANNVLAQVPDLHDFVSGLRALLKPRGVVSIEFPHVVRLIDGNQFDTIYHEHFSYFSLLAAERVFARHDLRCFDVEELPTHGGSLRLSLCHAADDTKTTHDTVAELEGRERAIGVERLPVYAQFGERVKMTKQGILQFLNQAKRDGRRVAGYGAPGKGNTLLNYCGIGTDLIDFTVDRNPYKQGKLLPGSKIPVHHPDKIWETKPDYLFILPWNLKDEIIEQMGAIRAWGGRFVIPIPQVAVIP